VDGPIQQCFKFRPPQAYRPASLLPGWKILVRLNSSNSRDGARAHAFVLEVLERRGFFDHFGSIPRLV
jgi:hypothetical protein